MKKLAILLIMNLITTTAFATESPELVKKLSEAKMNLVDAISWAEKVSGPATSAKFELDGDQLVFSVYTAPQGLNTAPENTDLSELSGNASTLPIAGKTEIFADKEHLARASSHLTLMQLSRFTLSQIIKKALAHVPGMAYSVKNPEVRNHKAVADVLILTTTGQVETVTVNMMTGKIVE